LTKILAATGGEAQVTPALEAAVAASMVVLAAGCQAKFAYVANGNNVSGYTIDAITGALTRRYQVVHLRREIIQRP
jgi:hypothetical protein